MNDKRDVLEGLAMRLSGAATGTRSRMPARSISTTTGPTTGTTTSASADPENATRLDIGSANGRLLSGRTSRGAGLSPCPESMAREAQPETAAGATAAAAEFGSTTTNRCDCLNSCGDDPWLLDGRAKPCSKLIQRRAQQKQRQEDIEQLLNFAKTSRNRIVAGALQRILPSVLP